MRIVVSAVLATTLITSAAMAQSPFNYRPPKGVVPDANTAVRIAEAVLSPIYGADKIKREEPFRAISDGEVWHVRGDMHCDRCLGGVAEIEISKTDGRVLRIGHGK